MENWETEGADLLDALMDCESADEAHDWLINHAGEVLDLITQLREAGRNKGA